MTISTRPLNRTGLFRSALALRGILTTVALIVLAALAFAAPAGATVTEVEGDTVGLQPRDEANVHDGLLQENIAGGFFENSLAESFANPAGNTVLHGSDVNVIYWDPGDPTTHTNYYHDDWVRLIDRFLTDVGHENGSLADVFAVDSQYTDKSNVPAANDANFRTSYEDDAPYPASECTDPRPFTPAKAHKIVPLGCVTDAQVQQQLKSFITLHGLPTGLGEIYYVLTPPGLTVCLDKGGASGHCSDFAATNTEIANREFASTSYEHSFCSYHSDINPDKVATGDASTILYGVIPWTAGGVDDGQLNAADEQMPGYFCQDGGFDPSSKPIEKREKPREVSKKEKEAFEEMDNEEKKPIEEARQDERPHEEEPNQAKCPTEDGFCDVGLADLIINQIAVEQQNIITDPLLNAWKDSAGNEVTDECRNFFAPVLGSATANAETGAGTLYNQELNGHDYYLNSAFNASALHLNFPGVFCNLGVNLTPGFNEPSPVNANEGVGFNGMESDISLDAATDYSSGGAPQTTYATYTWDFGDGSPAVSGFAPGAPACETPWLSPCAASVFHSYTYGGTYTVTLTVKDVGGNIASVSHEVTVSGPPKPEPATAGPAAGAAASPSSTASLLANGKVVGAPIARAAIVSRKLPLALRKGVSVSYSVNEQVSGHFEILLSRSTAARLHVSGPAATGMAPGAAPQVVIAKAFLITTKGGNSTISIKLSKRTAAELGKSHKLLLTLRLIVRNAAVKNPLTTTVVSNATLTG